MDQFWLWVYVTYGCGAVFTYAGLRKMNRAALRDLYDWDDVVWNIMLSTFWFVTTIVIGVGALVRRLENTKPPKFL